MVRKTTKKKEKRVKLTSIAPDSEKKRGRKPNYSSSSDTFMKTDIPEEIKDTLDQIKSIQINERDSRQIKYTKYKEMKRLCMEMFKSRHNNNINIHNYMVSFLINDKLGERDLQVESPEKMIKLNWKREKIEGEIDRLLKDVKGRIAFDGIDDFMNHIEILKAIAELEG